MSKYTADSSIDVPICTRAGSCALTQCKMEIVSELVAFLGLSPYASFNLQVGKPHSYPAMEPALRKELSDYFRPYNEELEVLLGRKFGWE